MCWDSPHTTTIYTYLQAGDEMDSEVIRFNVMSHYLILVVSAYSLSASFRQYFLKISLGYIFRNKERCLFLILRGQFKPLFVFIYLICTLKIFFR